METYSTPRTVQARKVSEAFVKSMCVEKPVDGVSSMIDFASRLLCRGEVKSLDIDLNSHFAFAEREGYSEDQNICVQSVPGPADGPPRRSREPCI